MKYALAETRRILRHRFARYLPLTQSAPSAPKSGNLLPDEQLLELLLGLNILCESDVDRSRATYDAALPLGGGEPSLDEVIAAGWMRVVWGRVTHCQCCRFSDLLSMTPYLAALDRRAASSFDRPSSIVRAPNLCEQQFR